MINNLHPYDSSCENQSRPEKSLGSLKLLFFLILIMELGELVIMNYKHMYNIYINI